MGWLVGYVMASLAASFIVVRVLEYIFAGATGWVVSTTKVGTFVTVWTAITTAAGMRDFTSRVRGLRRLGDRTSKRIEVLTKGNWR